jgi:hypothetical protein
MVINTKLVSKLHIIVINGITIFITFYVNSRLTPANAVSPKVVAREYYYSITTEENFLDMLNTSNNNLLARPQTNSEQIFPGKFSNKARDLLIFPDNNLSNKDRVELLNKLLFAVGNTNIEIGEYSCYSANGVMMRFLNIRPVRTIVLYWYTPTQQQRTINLESRETALPVSYCNSVINIGYELSYLRRQIEIDVQEMIHNSYTQNSINNLDIEINIQNGWNSFKIKNHNQ